MWYGLKCVCHRFGCSVLDTTWLGWTSALLGLACLRFTLSLPSSQNFILMLALCDNVLQSWWWHGGDSEVDCDVRYQFWYCWSWLIISEDCKNSCSKHFACAQYHGFDHFQIPEPVFLEGLRQLLELEQDWVGASRYISWFGETSRYHHTSLKLCITAIHHTHHHHDIF